MHGLVKWDIGMSAVFFCLHTESGLCDYESWSLFVKLFTGKGGFDRLLMGSGELRGLLN